MEINEETIFKVYNYDNSDWNQEYQISAGGSSDADPSDFDLHDNFDKGMVARPERSKSSDSTKKTVKIFDENSSEEEQEQELMFKHIMEHVPSMKAILKSHKDLKFKRLNGNSNACFKVSIKDGLYL